MYEITETDAKTASVIRRRAAHEKEAPAHADAAVFILNVIENIPGAPFNLKCCRYCSGFLCKRQLYIFEKFPYFFY